MAEVTVSEPFPIHLVANRHIIYDAATVTHIRREYHITGTLIGGLPQAPQQNVFLGIPLELMPEEARLLVEKGVAYIIDDAQQHSQAFLNNGMSGGERERFRRILEKQGIDAGKLQAQKAGERKESALKKIAAKEGKTDNWNDIPDDMFSSSRSGSRTRTATKGKKGARSGRVTPIGTPVEERSEPVMGGPPKMQLDVNPEAEQIDEETNLFSSSSSSNHRPSESVVQQQQQSDIFKITPATSYPPLTTASSSDAVVHDLPSVPTSYPLYKHLHEKDYFLAPGLRFGCQYMAYPGDPLRFHSHFLCKGLGWDDEFDLLELVGGGRLGTGVKKGFLLGGEEKGRKTTEDRDTDGADVRAFCIEWAGM